MIKVLCLVGHTYLTGEYSRSSNALGIITEPMFLDLFPQMEPTNKSGAIQALVVAIYEVGCLVGTPVLYCWDWKASVLTVGRWEHWE